MSIASTSSVLMIVARENKVFAAFAARGYRGQSRSSSKLTLLTKVCNQVRAFDHEFMTEYGVLRTPT